MIDRVIICNVRRANELLPIRDIQQSIGRAGRSYTQDGEAIILSPESDLNYAQRCLTEKDLPVVSEMSTVEKVAFHILPFIDDIKDEDDFNRWHGRSLAFVQGKKTDWNELKAYLESKQSIKDGKLTDLGRVSVRKYFSPDRVFTIKEKMHEAWLEGSIEELAVLSWMLAYKHIQIGDADGMELSSYKNLVHSYGLRFTSGELMHGFAYFCIISNRSPRWLKHQITADTDDLPRLFSACSIIAGIENIPIQDRLNEVMISALKRVPVEIARLIDMFDLQRKANAYELYDMGIMNKAELKEMQEYVWNYGTDNLKNELVNKGLLENPVIANSHKI